MKERDIVINIESYMNNTMEETRSPDVSADLAEGEYSVNMSRNAKSVGGVSPDLEEKNKGKRMSMSAKKPPKPPRPPSGLSIDATDQKLIKEISELLMIKRARIEGMKALKKMKAAKASSASTSSSGNLIAVLFTILFCILIVFQGCHPSGIWLRNHSANGIPTSPK